MTNNVYTTITVPYIIDTNELWSRIWGSDPYSFGSWWRGVEFVACDWNRIGGGMVHVTLEDPDDDGAVIERSIVIDDIVAALSAPSFPHHLRQNILDDNADCVDSDAVIQKIVYGEIVFG